VYSEDFSAEDVADKVSAEEYSEAFSEDDVGVFFV
jgi:hypothetical protein